jgi:hypothetical protein
MSFQFQFSDFTHYYSCKILEDMLSILVSQRNFWIIISFFPMDKIAKDMDIFVFSCMYHKLTNREKSQNKQTSLLRNHINLSHMDASIFFI